MAHDVERRLEQLAAGGVHVVDPRQTYVADDVVLERIRPGVVLHPGTRLQGARTWLSAGVHVGAEGPATVVDAVFGPEAAIDSGHVHGAVLLRGARLGANAHVRPGTLLEESASTAHAVGLKHTILLAFVTIGSVVNFCDVLMAGGTSRKDHSEVGSGFIHFNFTPWGRSGDKATASLVGDVVEGVLLRSPRIFLGGAGGMIGPRAVGYGAVAAAGQVIRRDLAAGHLGSEPTPKVDVEIRAAHAGRTQPRTDRNVAYIGQLVALRAWYRDVRLARARDQDAAEVLRRAIETIELAMRERVDRLRAFLDERGEPMPALVLDPPLACPLDVHGGDVRLDHVAWVQSLGEGDVAVARAWLQAVAAAVRAD